MKLRYAAGWRLPGGGRDEHEDPSDAGLREQGTAELLDALGEALRRQSANA